MKRVRLIRVVATVILLIMLMAPAGGSFAASGRTKLIGHRGYSARYPENTMPAFKGAYRKGFDGIEVDLWESNNGDLMIFHDSDTRDLTGRSGKIWKVNTGNRNKYKVRQHGRKAQIPTLQEVLRYSKKTGLTVLLHIKSAKGHRISKKGARKTVSLIKQYGVEDRVVIFASSAKNMKHFRKQGVRLGRLCTSRSRKDVNKTIDWLVRNGGDTLLVHRVSIMKKKSFGKKIVRYCHKRNIQVGTYWTYSKKEFRYMKSVGADFAMANYYLK